MPRLVNSLINYNKVIVMEIFLFMAGAILGFIVGRVVGWCEMENTYRRVKNPNE